MSWDRAGERAAHVLAELLRHYHPTRGVILGWDKCVANPDLSTARLSVELGTGTAARAPCACEEGGLGGYWHHSSPCHHHSSFSSLALLWRGQASKEQFQSIALPDLRTCYVLPVIIEMIGFRKTDIFESEQDIPQSGSINDAFQD